MTQIHKFSLSYDAAEDRLAWDTEDTAGVTTRLWLTQRLCRGLVTAILPLLEARQDVPPQHQATVQSWEQAAAMADFGKVPAVRPDARTASGLVSAVHITPTAEGFDLKFDFGAGDHRTVGVVLPALRQTLDVVHRLNVAAEWSQDHWPAWITQPTLPVPADAVN